MMIISTFGGLAASAAVSRDTGLTINTSRGGWVLLLRKCIQPDADTKLKIVAQLLTHILGQFHALPYMQTS